MFLSKISSARQAIKNIAGWKLRRCFSLARESINLGEEVSQAVLENKPIVALESTIITHGMPFPENLQTAKDVERIIRENGAIPATIAILEGRVTVGLSSAQLSDLSNIDNCSIKTLKTSRRDMAYVMAQGLNGGTTVSGTIVVANSLGIPVFVTGGIGGVHRMGQETMDISADLTELARNRICVVSSGVKSILDIGRTLEFLETQGVAVVSYCNGGEFPSFYTRKSGHLAAHDVTSAELAAGMIEASERMLLTSGILVAVPVPEEYAMDDSVIESAIKEALEDASRKSIKGKDVTPHVLQAIGKVTAGKSLQTNMALIKNNAMIGARIAVALKTLKSARGSRYLDQYARYFQNGRPDAAAASSLNGGKQQRPIIIGGSNVDLSYYVAEPEIKLNGSTHPVKSKMSAGGVGRNIAENLVTFGRRPFFVSAIGNDANGTFLTSLFPVESRDGLFVAEGQSTATYSAVFDQNGECRVAFGDMEAHKRISSEVILKHKEHFRAAPLIILDGNVPETTMDTILQLANEFKKPVFFEPTDIRKAQRPFLLNNTRKLQFSTPNLNEFYAISGSKTPNHENEDTILQNIAAILPNVSQKIETVIITLGKLGVVICRRGAANLGFFDEKSQYLANSGDIEARLYPVNRIDNVVNVSGAGDCFASGFIHSMLRGFPEEICMSVGLEAAKYALKSENAVPDRLFDEGQSCWNETAQFVTLL